MKTKKILYIALTISILNLNLRSDSVVQEDKFIYHNFASIEEKLDYNPVHINFLSIRTFFDKSYTTIQNMNRYRNFKDSKTATFHKSMYKYIIQDYNDPNYANYLSQNGNHILEFMKICNELNMDIEIKLGVIRLLRLKLISCEVVDASIINQVIYPLPHLLKSSLEPENNVKENLKFLKKNIERTLLTNFTEHWGEFNDAPDVFLSDLSTNISMITKQEIERVQRRISKQETKERLRQTVIKLFETLISKAIWDINWYESIWQSVLSTGHGIQMLASSGIVDHMDDLDDLLWALTYRFCYFLELMGPQLPLSFFDEIENDLESKVVLFLEEPELDEGIKSKKEILIESLNKAKAMAIATNKGYTIDTSMV